MIQTFVSLHDQVTEICFPADLAPIVSLLFSPQAATPAEAPARRIAVEETAPERYRVVGDLEQQHAPDMNVPELLETLVGEVLHSLVDKLTSAVALHAAAVAWDGASILIPGRTGAGKTSLTGWLVAQGFGFLSDELVVLPDSGRTTLTLKRPLLAKPGSDELVGIVARTGRARPVSTAGGTLLVLDERADEAPGARQAGLLVFPQFDPTSRLCIEPLTPAMASLRLMQCNLNARNLADFGLARIASLVRDLPAIGLSYGAFAQLDGVVDTFAKFMIGTHASATGLQKFVSAFRVTPPSDPPKLSKPPQPISPDPQPIPARSAPSASAKKLTIGMATYDDFDGTYFTLQAIRLYHPEVLDDVDFVVVDNHPDGPCGPALKGLEACVPNLKYVPVGTATGTSVRDFVFREARGDFVLCLDCHVLLAGGALRSLLDYIERHPDSDDLIQGPLVFDDLSSIATKLRPEWRAGMFGVWDTEVSGRDLGQDPFELPMQGLGLFACRRLAWPGFNPYFRGFGGEEGYIHEKFRQRGARTLCLPGLRWLHRFNRPLGVPYANTWDDRVRNYLIGFRELGLPTAAVGDHFRSHLGEPAGSQLIDKVERDLEGSPYARDAERRAGAAVCGAEHEALSTQASASVSGQSPAGPGDCAFDGLWDEASLDLQRRLMRRVSDIAAAHRIPLFLFWGTLLGHVREGRILAWDDDVDLALFGADDQSRLRAALEADGLEVWAMTQDGHLWVKVCDPTYPLVPRRHWSWPYVDVFLYGDGGSDTGRSMPVPRELVFPGTITTFEGARFWTPERPLEVLDRHYEGWREQERTHFWNHREERSRGPVVSRPISTDARGRKIRAL